MCDLIDVELGKSAKVDNAVNQQLTVAGRFKIRPQIIGGTLGGLYCLKKAVVVDE